MRPIRHLVAATLVALAMAVTGCSDEGDGDPAPARAEGGDTDTATAATPADRDLVVRWWNWAAAQPEETNPMADADGSDCSTGQPTDVWFLANTFGGEAVRSCAVPAGRQFLAPILNQVCSPDARCEITDPTFTATLDGEPLDAIAVTNDVFTVTGHPENPVTFAPEPVEFVGTGFWVRFGPLTPGEHTLVLEGAEPSGFNTKVTYTLTVS